MLQNVKNLRGSEYFLYPLYVSEQLKNCFFPILYVLLVFVGLWHFSNDLYKLVGDHQQVPDCCLIRDMPLFPCMILNLTQLFESAENFIFNFIIFGLATLLWDNELSMPVWFFSYVRNWPATL